MVGNALTLILVLLFLLSRSCLAQHLCPVVCRKVLSSVLCFLPSIFCHYTDHFNGISYVLYAEYIQFENDTFAFCLFHNVLH